MHIYIYSYCAGMDGHGGMGVAGMIIASDDWDHSRKFPAVSTSPGRGWAGRGSVAALDAVAGVARNAQATWRMWWDIDVIIGLVYL